MNREIVPKVKVIINDAIKEAKANEDTHVKPEHILMALLLDSNNSCVNILKKLNIDLNDLHDKLSQYIRDKNLTPRSNVSKRIRLPFNDDMKNISKTCKTPYINFNTTKNSFKTYDGIHIDKFSGVNFTNTLCDSISKYTEFSKRH